MATGGSSNNSSNDDSTGGGFFDSIGGFFDSIGDALGGLFDSGSADSSSSGGKGDSKGDSKSDSKSDSKGGDSFGGFLESIGGGLASVGTGGGKSSSSSSKDEKSSSSKTESKGGGNFLDALMDLLDFDQPSKDVESKSATAATTSRPTQTTSSKNTVGGLSKNSKLDKVDDKLVTILDTAAKNLGREVGIKSGYREGDSRQHGRGKAVDVTLFDEKGKAIPDYQSAKGFRDYEKFAQEAKAVQREMFPELEQGFRWGGYFGGKSNYGALDAMHFDLGGRPGLGMKGGSWEEGLNDKQRGYFAGIESVGMGKGLESYMASRGSREEQPTMVASAETPRGTTSGKPSSLFEGFDLIADVMGVNANPLSTLSAAFNNPSKGPSGSYRDPNVTSVEGRAARGETKESIAQARKDNDFGIADIFAGSNGRSGFGAFRDAIESGDFLGAVEQAGLAVASPMGFMAATVADGFNQSKQMNSPGPEGIGGDLSQGFLAASAQASQYDKPDWSGSSDWSPNNGDQPGNPNPIQEQQIAAVAPTPAQQATIVPPKRKPFGWSKLA